MRAYRKYFQLIILSVITIMIHGCYYDIEEELYPNDSFCDTTAISYSLSVKPLLDANCIGCHSTAANQGNVILDSYTKAKQYADAGTLLGAIRHDQGFSPMPQGGNKLNNCNIAKIQKWVSDGSPNN